MKIAHVVTALSLGGAEQVAEDLAIAYRARGVEAHLVALVAPDPALAGFSDAMRARLCAAGIGFHELGARDRQVGLLRKLPALAALLAHERFDLVHAHVDHAEFAVSLVGRVQRFALARTIHNTVLWPGHPRLARISERGWRNDLVIAVSPSAMEAHMTLRQEQRLPLSPHRHTITNGVPLAEGGASIRIAGPLRAAFFGRSTPQKGLDVLIAALRAMPPGGAPFELTIHSDAAFDPAMRTQVAGLAGVTLLPPIADARARFTDFDLIVMPSRFEGLPLVAVEAFTSGTPVLATDAPGLLDVLPDHWPLLVPRDNAQALADALTRAAQSVDAIRAMRAQAAAHGRGFAIERTADRYVDAYKSYLATNAAGKPG